MTLLHRKTPTMVILELKHQKAIDVLMLEALTDASGVQLSAANELGISAAAFSRWLVQLNLVNQAGKIRQHFGVTPTINDLVSAANRDGTVEYSKVVISECLECGKKAEDITTVELLRVREEGNGRVILTVKDDKYFRHQFEIDPKKL